MTAGIVLALALLRGFFFIVGDELAERAEVPHARLGDDLELLSMDEPRVGWMYRETSIMGVLPIVATEGRWVLYDAERDRSVYGITEDDVRELTGESADDLGTPLTYWVPAFWWLLVPLGLFGVYRLWDRRRMLREVEASQRRYMDSNR